MFYLRLHWGDARAGVGMLKLDMMCEICPRSGPAERDRHDGASVTGMMGVVGPRNVCPLRRAPPDQRTRPAPRARSAPAFFAQGVAAPARRAEPARPALIATARAAGPSAGTQARARLVRLTGHAARATPGSGVFAGPRPVTAVRSEGAPAQGVGATSRAVVAGGRHGGGRATGPQRPSGAARVRPPRRGR